LKIAVIGSRGQLGSELCRRLGPRGLAIDRAALDITDRPAVLQALQRLDPTAVINTAAYTQVDRAEQEPAQCFAVNASAVDYLAEACRGLDCPLVQISSDYVFGGDLARTTAYREEDPPAPLSVYGQSKLAGEAAAATCPRHFVVRTCGLYGAGVASPHHRNFVDTMLALAVTGRKLRLVDDQRCTPSYVPDVAAAVLQLIETSGYGTYHVVNHGEATWCDFAAEIFRISGLPVEYERITTAQFAAPAARPLFSVLDTAKYAALCGTPLRPWQAALAEYLHQKGYPPPPSPPPSESPPAPRNRV